MESTPLDDLPPLDQRPSTRVRLLRNAERLMPGVATARHYRRAWLGRDIVAGAALSGLLAPVGIAYATAAGLPAVTGLYATIVPMLVYALVGPSRVLILGPSSSLTPVIAAAIVPLAAVDGTEAVALAGLLSLMAGAICLAAGLARMGFIAELLSAPVRLGYLHGIALTIIVAQLARTAGFSITGEELVPGARLVIDRLADGAFEPATFVVGAASLLTVVVVRRLHAAMPAALIAVVGGIVASLLLDLGDRGVGLVGDLPRGVPTPRLPTLDLGTVRLLLGAAFGVALVAFADTSVLSRSLAVRRREPVDANRELGALGAVNIAAGLFGGFPVSGSNSRTPVVEAAGARSQLAGVTAAVVLLGVTALAPATFRHLPQATLAAVVIAAALGLVDLRAWHRLWQVRRSEFVLAASGLVSVAVLGPVDGVVVAVALSVLDFLRRVWTPHTAELVRVDGLKGYHDRERHPEGRVIPGLLLYRFDGPLFFANARAFATDLRTRIDARRAEGHPVRCVVVTAEPITDIDTTAAETLRDLIGDLRRAGIELRFAELKGVVRDRVDRYGIAPDVRRDLRTTGEAVRAYVEDYGVAWADWDER